MAATRISCSARHAAHLLLPRRQLRACTAMAFPQELPLSRRIQQTDAPCIVKTKKLMAGREGVLSLAQGEPRCWHQRQPPRHAPPPTARRPPTTRRRRALAAARGGGRVCGRHGQQPGSALVRPGRGPPRAARGSARQAAPAKRARGLRRHGHRRLQPGLPECGGGAARPRRHRCALQVQQRRAAGLGKGVSAAGAEAGARPGRRAGGAPSTKPAHLAHPAPSCRRPKPPPPPPPPTHPPPLPPGPTTSTT
jgi:hypothetical protein